eukprot:1161112-Pelagomonas_calceolata.AAC.16
MGLMSAPASNTEVVSGDLISLAEGKIPHLVSGCHETGSAQQHIALKEEIKIVFPPQAHTAALKCPDYDLRIFKIKPEQAESKDSSCDG